MFYLQISTPRRRPRRGPAPLSPTHGPFATSQEAEGFFTKLTLWYPRVMQQATFRVIFEGEPARREVEHVSRFC
ncbi:MAG TPA: hypothetical protein VKT32_13755 [Chthonomonadaceae bacterium]|nr:hypothetical protein [Chthonomonadaceae bacterium]